MSILPPGADPNIIPLAPNPDGSPPDFVSIPTLAPASAGISITMAVVTTLLVAIRISTYTRMERGIKLDDAFCILALVMAIISTALMDSSEAPICETMEVYTDSVC